MQATRQKILSLLGSGRPASPAEIARQLQLTPANIRHHLALLESAGQVEVASRSIQPGRGRQALRYTLSQAAQPNNLALLTRLLFDELDPSQAADLLNRLVLRLAGSLPSQSDPSRFTSQRLASTVQRLNELNYRARWEAHADAPRLILGHCPYAGLADERPELCQLDSRLIEALTGLQASQTVKLQRSAQGQRQCIFHLARPPKTNPT